MVHLEIIVLIQGGFVFTCSVAPNQIYEYLHLAAWDHGKCCLHSKTAKSPQCMLLV